ncbi:hypothetical protein ACFLQI_00275 [Candidatus Undinarchaeota archaeon]
MPSQKTIAFCRYVENTEDFIAITKDAANEGADTILFPEGLFGENPVRGDQIPILYSQSSEILSNGVDSIAFSAWVSAMSSFYFNLGYLFTSDAPNTRTKHIIRPNDNKVLKRHISNQDKILSNLRLWESRIHTESEVPSLRISEEISFCQTEADVVFVPADKLRLKNLKNFQGTALVNDRKKGAYIFKSGKKVWHKKVKNDFILGVL